MRKIWYIFKRDLKAVFRNPVAAVIAVGIMILPSLYAWFNIAANWDPYGNTGELKVAVVNEDEGLDIESMDLPDTAKNLLESKDINIGNMVEDNLKMNDQIGWQFVSKDEAMDGVSDGTYYAAVVIPSDFSSDIASILSENVNHPEIEYYVNEKKNAIATKITDKGVGTIQQQVNESFISAVSEADVYKRQGYGQTETTLLMANFKGRKPVEGSMGTISPFYNIELRNKAGEKVSVGEIGEVVIIPPENGRQAGVFCGYLDNEKQYEYVWRGGVYHTGDAAYMDENGLYWFHGRFDDIIKTGGFRVGPYEVENVLMEHPAVVECSVIGVPDRLRGQAIKAVVILGNDYAPSKKLELEIKEFCNQKLAEYKWIRIVEFVKEMPKTISGKIQKTVLRSQNG